MVKVLLDLYTPLALRILWRRLKRPQIWMLLIILAELALLPVIFVLLPERTVAMARSYFLLTVCLPIISLTLAQFNIYQRNKTIRSLRSHVESLSRMLDESTNVTQTISATITRQSQLLRQQHDVIMSVPQSLTLPDARTSVQRSREAVEADFINFLHTDCMPDHCAVERHNECPAR